MTEIRVNLTEISNANYELFCMKNKIRSIRKRMWKFKREILPSVSEQYLTGQRLHQTCMEIEKLESQIEELYEVTNACVEQYAQAEYTNSENARAFCL